MHVKDNDALTSPSGRGSKTLHVDWRKRLKPVAALPAEPEVSAEMFVLHQLTPQHLAVSAEKLQF